ncbi:uncharacterized protein LOC124305932 isoform X1 [Neodiprion virginianus]|uniref:uncharacterized protein LOC124305932 isoform X1 n=2 Tax=Neodiprion virginianus TaxID=2961670 RepID=UPI001EE6A2E2|nr:uncharacterized protein LOC124305932 isoform X1 [Neodiprion virginianus]
MPGMSSSGKQQLTSSDKLPSEKNPAINPKRNQDSTPKADPIPAKGSVNVGERKPEESSPQNVAPVKSLAATKKISPPSIDPEAHPLVLATHLVPSIPVGLFEVLAEAVEAATRRPVSLVYESRSDRPVAKDIVDLAILPAYSDWKEGELLPVTFVFAHRLNDGTSGNVYVDIVVAADHGPYVKNILDLRGHRCALPDPRRRRGAATLLLSDLRSKGESPAFFGNTLDSGSQISTLKMVAGKQTEVGVVEAPVLNFHQKRTPSIGSLFVLGSLGPLPPYAIYVNKSVSAELRKKISSYLLSAMKNEHWTERFSPYGVIGFTSNSLDAYVTDEGAEDVPTTVRYY